jgi:Kef-type K+ transport system membrane component KefB
VPLPRPYSGSLSLTTNFLLPLFFIYSGLNTKLGLVLSPNLWILTLAVVAIACAGKGAGCTIAALCNGETKWNAIAIGALMNSRGLMELILLNVGLERGLITPALFTVMVIMALVTTMMTAPVFEWASRCVRRLNPAANANIEGESIEAVPASAIAGRRAYLRACASQESK